MENDELLARRANGSVQTIRIDVMLIAMLKMHRVRQNEIKMRNRMIYKKLNYIFAREDGCGK